MNNTMEIQREAIVEIVGTQYDGRATNHKNLMFHQRLVMKHQSDNADDHNAVLILTDDGRELGFMPKGYASLYAPAIDSGRYSFAIEIIKTEYDSKRPILIVKIISEFDNCSEEEIERNILQFVQNVVNEYSQRKDEYLNFIYLETINIDELLTSLNRLRLIQKLYSLSGDIITNHNIEQTTSEYSPYTKEVLLFYKFGARLETYSPNTKEMILKTIDELKANINNVLKKIEKEYNESIDIDDEEEYYKVQSEIRKRRKKFRSYNDLFTCYRESVEKYVVIKNESVSENFKTVIENENSSEPKQNLIVDKSSNLTEKAFFDWLVSDSGVSEATAKQYISNIHSIEKLYQSLYGIRKNILGAVSADSVKAIMETLISRNEYIDANERRHNSFSATLNKFAQFADISVDGLKIQSEKKNYQSPVNSDSFIIKLADENDNNTQEDCGQILMPVQIAADSMIKSPTTHAPAKIVPYSLAEPQIGNETPESVRFTPDTTKPFVLKDAVIEILSSDASEITNYKEYKNGISSKVLCEMLKEYYGKIIGLFEISKLLIRDKTFKSVGKGYYVLNPAIIPQDKEKDGVLPKEEIKKSPDFSVSSFTDLQSESIQATSEDNITIETILDIIKKNSDNLQYEDGFGAYEIKTLLANQGIIGISEETIETLMTECSELNEIEDGYYILADTENNSILTELECSDITGEQVDDATETITKDTITHETVSDTRCIVLRINGSIIRAYDYSDALNKACEFAINCEPFKMARIVKQGIHLKGSNVFYREAVPVDGYNKLSNGLQIKAINTLTDLQTITDEVKKYCQIDNDMITIISK